MTSGITNRIPASELMGDSSQSSGTGNVSISNGGTTNFALRPVYSQYSNGNQYLTINTTPPADSVTVIVCSGYVGPGNSTASANLRRGTTVLTGYTFGGSLTYVDLTPGTSATSYNSLMTGTAFLTHVQMTIKYITLTDTHTAQSKKLNEVIS